MLPDVLAVRFATDLPHQRRFKCTVEGLVFTGLLEGDCHTMRYLVIRIAAPPDGASASSTESPAPTPCCVTFNSVGATPSCQMFALNLPAPRNASGTFTLCTCSFPIAPTYQSWPLRRA